MIKHFCDLCGKEINVLQETYKVRVENTTGVPYRNDLSIVGMHEICPDCANRICQTVRQLKQEADNGEA